MSDELFEQLLEAIEEREPDTVRELLSRPTIRARINDPIFIGDETQHSGGPYDDYLLTRAIGRMEQDDEIDIPLLLIRAGADVNIPFRSYSNVYNRNINMTPLIYAIEHDGIFGDDGGVNLVRTRALLEAGANPNSGPVAEIALLSFPEADIEVVIELYDLLLAYRMNRAPLIHFLETAIRQLPRT